MTEVNKNEVSEFIKELLVEAASTISTGKVSLCTNENLPPNVQVQLVVKGNGEYAIYIRPETLGDDYTISHEILHICASRVIPNFVRVLEPNVIGMIGTELQGYLEHNWIRAEQEKRGLIIDEQKLYQNLEQTLGSDQEGIEANINRILTLNNILHAFPSVYEKHKDFLHKNNSSSLAMSQRIMSHYPRQVIYSNYEARKATIQALKEWNKIIKENGIISVNLNLLLSVTPVFSAAQLKRAAGVILGLIPNAIVNHEKETTSHVLYTRSDGQGCVIFSMDENGLRALDSYMNKMTLEEFLEMANMTYLLR